MCPSGRFLMCRAPSITPQHWLDTMPRYLRKECTCCDFVTPYRSGSIHLSRLRTYPSANDNERRTSVATLTQWEV
jgi:hypothetical protein